MTYENARLIRARADLARYEERQRAGSAEPRAPTPAAAWLLFTPKPRIRVKAWTRRITMDEYFMSGIQWSVAELRAIADAAMVKEAKPRKPPLSRARFDNYPYFDSEVRRHDS